MGVFSFKYSGDFKYKDGNGSEVTGTRNEKVYIQNTNWYVKFLTDGTLTTYNDANIDVFLVGGGYNGGYVTTGTYQADVLVNTQDGGPGGSGGKTYTSTASVTTNGTYSIDIGGKEEASIAFSKSSNSGTSLPGGAGAKCYGTGDYYASWRGYAGQNGPYTFGDSSLDGVRYGSSGGGGGSYCGSTGHGSNLGGENAGEGGESNASGGYPGQDGVANTGGGGGGALNCKKNNKTNCKLYDVPHNVPGNGASGIVIIRNKR